MTHNSSKGCKECGAMDVHRVTCSRYVKNGCVVVRDSERVSEENDEFRSILATPIGKLSEEDLKKFWEFNDKVLDQLGIGCSR